MDWLHLSAKVMAVLVEEYMQHADLRWRVKLMYLGLATLSLTLSQARTVESRP